MDVEGLWVVYMLSGTPRNVAQLRWGAAVATWDISPAPFILQLFFGA